MGKVNGREVSRRSSDRFCMDGSGQLHREDMGAEIKTLQGNLPEDELWDKPTLPSLEWFQPVHLKSFQREPGK